MAETYEATRRTSEGTTQRVCLKLVLPYLRNEKEFVRLFEREARLAAKLHHSNIVGVFDHGSVDDTPYIALELVDGIDLLTLLRAQRELPFEYVALIAIDLARGLAHAHDPGLHGIVHRDICPSNVMLGRQGEVMLTDFGVAKAVSGAPSYQSAPTIDLPGGRIKGKVPYMSPEQLRNESIDGRADLFSLGVVLFEALSGSRPFVGNNDPGTIMKILQGEHLPLHEAAPEAPQAFCQVVDELLQANRELRSSTASEVVAHLEPFEPSPQVRRELGARVSELQETSRSESERDKTTGDTPKSGVSVRSVTPASEDETTGARRTAALAGLAVALVVAVLIGIIFLVVRPI